MANLLRTFIAAVITKAQLSWWLKVENLSVVDTPRSLGRHVSGWSKSNFYPSFRYRKRPIITTLLITPPPPNPHPFIGPSTCKQKYTSCYRLPPNISPPLACIKMNLTFYDVLLSCARAPLSQVTNNAHNRVFFFFFYLFIVSRTRELHAVKRLEHKCSLTFKSVWIFSTKYLLESILMVLFRWVVPWHLHSLLSSTGL